MAMPPTSLMNARRCMPHPLPQKTSYRIKLVCCKGRPTSALGQKQSAKSHVPKATVSMLCVRRNHKIVAQRTPNQISKRKMVSTDMPVEITTAGDTVLKYTLYC